MPSPLRNTVPIKWRPRGCSDASDGSTAFAGAMTALTNLVPDPSTNLQWVPRPAAELLTQFPGFVTPGFKSAMLVVGDIEYGMIATGRFAGYDEPYAYNLNTNAFLTIAGVTANNVPRSPPAMGDWTPPIMAVVGTRIIVCHPGFPGGSEGSVRFGWFDTSGATIQTVGDTVNGVAVIAGAPNTLAVQPGMTVSGVDITAGTTVIATSPTITNGSFVVGNTTYGSVILSGITTVYGLALVGATIVGPGIPNGTTVTVLIAANQLTLSQPATATASGVLFLVNNGQRTTPFYTGTSSGSSSITSVAPTNGLYVGQTIFGATTAGVPFLQGTTITAISGSTVSTNQPVPTGTVSFDQSGSFVVLSAPATGTADGSTITIGGGAFTTSTGNTITGQPFIYGNPSLAGLQPGQTVTGPGIPANTTVLALYSYQQGWQFTGTTHSNTTIDGIPDAGIPALVPGYFISGPGIPANTMVVGIGGSSGNWSITLSQSATASATVTLVVVGDVPANVYEGDIHFGEDSIENVATSPGNLGALDAIYVGAQIIMQTVPTPNQILTYRPDLNEIGMSVNAGLNITDYNFQIQGNLIQISNNATATNNTQIFAFGQGGQTGPQWGAGDTDRNYLPGKPLGVAQMNGRAWYVCGKGGIAFSDSGLPCRISNSPNVQFLTTNDGLECTAIGALQLQAPLTGGIVQSLMVFESVDKIQQINGDPDTGNLSMNALPVATGTLAPLSICPTEKGLAFISPEGLRIIDFGANVSPIVGANGEGVSVPFLNASSPSRICAAANRAIIRFGVVNGAIPSLPVQEWCFDMSRKVWHGPHTFAPSLIQPWRNTWVKAPAGVLASTWQSDIVPTLQSIYTENGSAMSWIATTILLPDNDDMSMNSVVQAELMASMTVDDTLMIAALDETGAPIPGSPAVIMGSSVYGNHQRQRRISFSQPIVFKQMTLVITGPSDNAIRVGSIYLRYEPLGYMLEDLVSNFLLDDAGNILTDDSGNELTPQ